MYKHKTLATQIYNVHVMSPKSMSQNVSSCNDYEQHGKMNFEFFPLLPFILQKLIMKLIKIYFWSTIQVKIVPKIIALVMLSFDVDQYICKLMGFFKNMSIRNGMCTFS